MNFCSVSGIVILFDTIASSDLTSITSSVTTCLSSVVSLFGVGIGGMFWFKVVLVVVAYVGFGMVEFDLI
jgi:hypothetical protein